MGASVMKRKEALFLIELLIMIAVLSLSTAICLSLFADSAAKSQNKAELDRSVIESRNVAEILRHSGGDFESCARLYGGTSSESALQIRYDGSWAVTDSEPVYLLTAAKKDSDIPTLGKGIITVTKNGVELFSLNVTWQAEAEHEK